MKKAGMTPKDALDFAYKVKGVLGKK